MANVIRNMNFKPIIEKLSYERLSEPQPNGTVNMRVWDDLKVERLRSDAVKIILTRYVLKLLLILLNMINLMIVLNTLRQVQWQEFLQAIYQVFYLLLHCIHK